MILYPFQPGRAGGYSIVGFDEQTRQPRGELLLLSAGESPPAEFRGSAIFGEACAAGDPRQLLPAALAPPDARGVWADTQISGGELEPYLRGLLAVWGGRLWVCLAPIYMLFPVPCPSGIGTPLPPDAAAMLAAQPPSHFSPELVCRYCFFLNETGQARVLLFDTEDTCRKKLALLRSLGVRQVFGPFPPAHADK